MKLSGPAAFPRLNLKICVDDPETDVIMSYMEGRGVARDFIMLMPTKMRMKRYLP